MLEEAEPELKGFFDQLYKGTNPGSKSNMTNEKNKKRLVLFCYFLVWCRSSKDIKKIGNAKAQ